MTLYESWRCVLRRYFCSFLGVALVALGVATTANARLGVAPISSIAYVAHCIAEELSWSPRFLWTLGATSFVLNLIFFVAQWALERGDFFRRQFWQLPLTFVFSALIDFFGWTLGDVFYRAYVMQLIGTFLGCFFVALVITFELVGDVLYLPGDGMVKSLACAVKAPFGFTKATFDVSLLVVSLFASFATLGYVVGLREGSAICALSVGPLARCLAPLVPRARASLRIAT